MLRPSYYTADWCRAQEDGTKQRATAYPLVACTYSCEYWHGKNSFGWSVVPAWSWQYFQTAKDGAAQAHLQVSDIQKKGHVSYFLAVSSEVTSSFLVSTGSHLYSWYNEKPFHITLNFWRWLRWRISNAQSCKAQGHTNYCPWVWRKSLSGKEYSCIIEWNIFETCDCKCIQGLLETVRSGWKISVSRIQPV